MYQRSGNNAWLDYAVTCYLQASLPLPNQLYPILVLLDSSGPDAKHCSRLERQMKHRFFLSRVLGWFPNPKEIERCPWQGVRYHSHEGRSWLPRVLLLLTFDNESGLVGKALDRAPEVPLWVWIAWIPQLLISLQRPESVHVKRILVQLAINYPQVRLWPRAAGR